MAGVRPAVDVATEFYEAFGCGDLDAMLGLLDPEVTWELIGPSEIPYFGAYRGVEGVRRFLALLEEHCQVEQFELESLIGTERGALAEGSERGRFVGRTEVYEMRWCHLLEISDGRIVRFVDHLDTAPMLAAWRS